MIKTKSSQRSSLCRNCRFQTIRIRPLSISEMRKNFVFSGKFSIKVSVVTIRIIQEKIRATCY
jgi:hypothetical protein